MTEKLENLDTRVTALEAGQDSRLDALAAVQSDTRRTVDEIKGQMATRFDVSFLRERLDGLATVSSDTRGAMHRVEESQKELVPKVATLQADVKGLDANVLGLKADVAMLKVGVSGLQADMSEVKGDVATLKGDVSELKGGVSQILTLVTHLVENSTSSAK